MVPMARIAIAALLVGSDPASALDIAACIRTESDLDRLACYDKAAGRTPAVIPLAPKGRWQTHAEKSALTDRTTVVLSLASNESPNCGWNRGAKITLVLRCHENRTAAYFDTGCHMASSDYNSYGRIEYRIDDEKARTANGDASTDNRSLGLWTGDQSIPFIKSLLGKKKLTARMTPYGENPFTVSFDISGVDDVVAPLRRACGW